MGRLKKNEDTIHIDFAFDGVLYTKYDAKEIKHRIDAIVFYDTRTDERMYIDTKVRYTDDIIVTIEQIGGRNNPFVNISGSFCGVGAGYSAPNDMEPMRKVYNIAALIEWICRLSVVVERFGSFPVTSWYILNLAMKCTTVIDGTDREWEISYEFPKESTCPRGGRTFHMEVVCKRHKAGDVIHWPRSLHFVNVDGDHLIIESIASEKNRLLWRKKRRFAISMHPATYILNGKLCPADRDICAFFHSEVMVVGTGLNCDVEMATIYLFNTPLKVVNAKGGNQ